MRGDGASARRALPFLEPEPGEIDGRGPPDVLLAEDALDEPLHHAQARRTADDLRMPEPVVEPALLVHPLELLGPDLPHVLVAPDAVPHGRIGAEDEKGRVVVAPGGGELHEWT